MSETDRRELVERARQQWISALTDLGGRNTLLYYKDRRAGTLDLAQADPPALYRVLETRSTPLTPLFPGAAARADGGAGYPGRVPGHRAGDLGRAVPHSGGAGLAARPDHHADPCPVRRLRSRS